MATRRDRLTPATAADAECSAARLPDELCRLSELHWVRRISNVALLQWWDLVSATDADPSVLEVSGADSSIVFEWSFKR